MTIISTILGRNPLEEMEYNFCSIVKKRVQNAVLRCNLKNDRIISVHFQGKPFNITIIQVYVPTTNVEEVEVEGNGNPLQYYCLENPMNRGAW